MKPYGKTLGPKTLEALHICSLPFLSEERERATELFVGKWSEKALHVTIINHGALFDYGVSPHGAWLTEKGELALAQAEAF